MEAEWSIAGGKEISKSSLARLVLKGQIPRLCFDPSTPEAKLGTLSAQDDLACHSRQEPTINDGAPITCLSSVLIPTMVSSVAKGARSRGWLESIFNMSC